MEFPSWERPFVLSNASFSDFRTPRSHFDGAALEATPGLHAGVEAEFIGRVIWFGQEADLWINNAKDGDFGISLLIPDGGTSLRDHFNIPGDSFTLAKMLSDIAPTEREALLMIMTFLKDCRLADTFFKHWSI